MRAGKLNSRVTVQQLVTGQDAVGQPVQTWATFATLWANVRHNSGAESIKSDADMSSVRASIRVRYNTTITAAMRVLVGGTVYHIKAVLPDAQMQDYTDLVCEVVQ